MTMIALVAHPKTWLETQATTCCLLMMLMTTAGLKQVSQAS